MDDPLLLLNGQQMNGSMLVRYIVNYASATIAIDCTRKTQLRTILVYDKRLFVPKPAKYA